MVAAKYTRFLLEAFQVTVIALIVLLILWLCGAHSQQLLIVLNMLVLSFVATYSGEDKHVKHIFRATSVIVASVILGGFVGFYAPLLAPWLVIIYTVLAFLRPKTKYYGITFVLGALIFLIFTSLPFSWQSGWAYIPCGLFVIFSLCVAFGLLHLKTFLIDNTFAKINKSDRQMLALTAGIAMVLAWICFVLMQRYTKIEHLYWIGLTVLTVTMASQQHFVKTALLRILGNIFAVLFIVLLMRYVVAQEWWSEFLLLGVFFFLIFASGFSYVLRVMFIAMFVLTFMAVAEAYSAKVAIERIYLTLLGSGLVVFSYYLSYWILHKKSVIKSKI